MYPWSYRHVSDSKAPIMFLPQVTDYRVKKCTGVTSEWNSNGICNVLIHQRWPNAPNIIIQCALCKSLLLIIFLAKLNAFVEIEIHANHIDSNPSIRSDCGPWNCEATALPTSVFAFTAKPCSHFVLLYYWYRIWYKWFVNQSTVNRFVNWYSFCFQKPWKVWLTGVVSRAGWVCFLIYIIPGFFCLSFCLSSVCG